MFTRYFADLLTPDTIINFAFWCLIAWLLRKRLLGLFGSSRIRAILVALSLAAVLAFTVRVFSSYTFTSSYWLFSSMWSGAFRVANGNWLLNFALFVPAGFALRFAGKSALRVLGFLSLLSLGIECLQFWARSGVADPADLVANTCGAVAGIAFATLALRATNKN
ncbi:MAG: VanZ family protein [Micrococcales bacterium]